MARHLKLLVLGLAVLVLATGQLAAQPGRGLGRGMGRGAGAGGPGGRGQGADAEFVVDRDTFHFLLQNHDKIQRQVTVQENGVETLTESDDPAVAARLQDHVAAMARRVESRQPIRMRDPLFAEVFAHAGKIALKFEKTEKGVRVVETSDDPYVATLIKAHAAVVDLFVKNGFEEAWRNHAVPGQAAAADKPADVPAAGQAACGKSAACAGCPKAAQCAAAGAVNPKCQGCPNAATCGAGQGCPKANAANPKCQTCPKAGQCAAGQGCASGGCTDAKCATCPLAGKCAAEKPVAPANPEQDAPPLP